MSQENMGIKGFWDIVLKDKDGNTKQSISGQNVITTNGKEALARYLYSATTSGANTFKHIAIGTGATAEAASDTAMGVETLRTTGTVSYVSGAIYEVIATFTGATAAIVEYGLFNTATAGTLFSRDTESVINITATDSLIVTTRVTLS